MGTDRYKFFTPIHLKFGTGIAGDIGETLEELGSKRILIVTDRGLVEAGLVDRIDANVSAGGRTSVVYPDIQPNPTVGNVHRGVEIVGEEGIDAIVAVGGGSSIDAAKAISALTANGGSIRDYELGKKAFSRSGPPLVVVPTTAGTGSEATMASVILDEDANRKFDIVSPHMAPAVSLVDPESTYTLPAALTAYTGMDALTHAVEGYTATLASPLTDAVHLKAITLLWKHLPGVVADGTNRDGRERVMMASMMAGVGFPNSGLGAVHGLSYALGCRYGLGHGLANAILLPHVMRFNAPSAAGKLREIGVAVGLKDPEPESLIDALMRIQREVGIPPLADFPVNPEDFPAMAEESLGEFSNCNTNPRPVGIDDAVAIYENAVRGA